MEETISLKEIAQVLKKRFWLILSTAVAAVAIAALLSYYFLTPTYEATTQFIVNTSQSQEESEFDVNDIRTGVELINTYNVVIKSPAILDDVISELELNRSADNLRQSLNISSEQNSQVVTVTVTDTNQNRAAMVANTTVEVFKEKIQDYMNVDNVNILSEAQPVDNPVPVSPKPLLNMAIALVLGLMVGVGIAFLLEYLDNTIKAEKDIEDKLGLPVLGIITHISEDEIVKSAEAANATSLRTKGGERRYATKQKETV
ncbi:capsular polysaccharide biosynthesis protein [Thalassobacillus devorans]|uniref:Capsular polysaccharide biosynthesis protein n=1 Tax=Thalassobacillus devorans TaxID=279813 RepID=A0ABQ1NUC7_9BACI|nr:Wzz/FepE/Etk N-terminal domain-containing protein [Thalassobacillus devorans]NIK28592.1 capsular polysaccharide biosynthesis protein [Thalassobacillus devorans]GGC85027.1 capsular polysaccharide biosynthesis protein [Thalassobacillus devorans]